MNQFLHKTALKNIRQLSFPDVIQKTDLSSYKKYKNISTKVIPHPFVIFTGMNKTLKHTYFMLLTFAITLVCANYCFSDTPLPHSHLGSHKECTDISNHYEYSHFSWDNVLISKTRLIPGTTLIDLDSSPALSVNLQSNFISVIWQPPKLS